MAVPETASETAPQPSSCRPFVVAVVVGALTLPVHARLVGGAREYVGGSDHLMHMTFVEQTSRGLSPPHPLYHYAVIAAAGGWSALFLGAAGPVLAVASGCAAGLAAWLIGRGREVPLAVLLPLCVALALAMPLPNWWKAGIYGGQITPNVWHNPTATFAMPFALLVFVLGFRTLERPTLGRVAGCGVALAAACLAKPNYPLAFVPVWGPAMLVGPVRGALAVWRKTCGVGPLSRGYWQDPLLYGLWRVAGKEAVFGLGPVVVVLAYQAWRSFGPYGGLTIAPFRAWLMASPLPPVSLLLGIAFPLGAAALFPSEARRDRLLLFAWAVFGVALAQYVLLAETGSRAAHGNWFWGTVAADQVLFVVTCGFVLRQPSGWRGRLCFSILFLHVASGILVLAKCMAWPQHAGDF